VAYLLEKEMSVEQGTLFDYNSTSSQALSEILTTATGVPTNEYAERHLFGPIGITEYFWNAAPEGYINAGGGLFLTAHDLSRFALLFLREGRWGEEQVVPQDWVRRSATSWVPVLADYPDGWGYGYQWWIYRHKTDVGPKMYGGWGWGGQFPLIVPELDLVAVFTGWNIKDDADYAYAFDLFYDRVVTSITAP
jgi:CubicO group peptidase (beta-lactamase class C family)